MLPPAHAPRASGLAHDTADAVSSALLSQHGLTLLIIALSGHVEPDLPHEEEESNIELPPAAKTPTVVTTRAAANPARTFTDIINLRGVTWGGNTAACSVDRRRETFLTEFMGDRVPPIPTDLRGAIRLSVAAALATIALKAAAAAATGSVGLLTDAVESGVNLVAAVTAYLSLRYSSRPADATHAFGHEKIEFFSSGVEGVLIVVAGATAVAFSAVRLAHGADLQRVDLGVGLTLLATGVNFAVGRHLVRLGRRAGSLLVEADGVHLLADVWTSVGVVVGLTLASATGRPELDALAGIVVGVQIARTGLRLLRRSFDGLMDRALEPAVQAELRQRIEAALPAQATFHMLRTRRAGRRVFVEFHLLVPGDTSVAAAHRLAHQVELRLHEWTPELDVTIHVEPIDEPAAWETAEMQRLGESP
jgi:cation diffusion facilitator family transporter